MMTSKELLHDNGGYKDSDLHYTPAHGVTPIIKYIPKGSVIWLPFTTVNGEYYKQLTAAGFEVVVSHIDDGKDFFEWEPEHFDIIIGNPPYKKKRLFFERALSFGKSFALLMTLACFNDRYPAWSFKEAGKELQLLKFDKRLKFYNPEGRPNNKITFQTGYMCSDFLPSNLILEALDDPA